MRVTFDEFELDVDAFELRRGGHPVPVEPQVFEVLAELVRNVGQLVTKEQLLDRVWGDRFVSESALTSRIKAARRALGDDGRQQRYIRTVHGRGYRFVAETDGAGREAAADPSTTGAPAGHLPVSDNLPRERTPLVGRDAEVARCVELIGKHRLVSLIGLGGVGKTRLAAASGRRLVDRVPGGVWFIDLVPVADGRSIAGAVARAAGLALAAGSSTEALAGLITDRRALFILDNCEHLVDEVARVLDQLLAMTAEPRFLVTSRLPLDLVDERRVQVEPLLLGDPLSAGPATQLFTTSADRFAVDVERLDPALVWSVCRQLDGLPLAIELAAAQLRHLALPDLASRLGQRFELLEARWRVGHDRHTGLATILAETWARLQPDEVDLFVQLAIFPRTFTLQDVEEVMGHLEPTAVARSLAGLVDLSLVSHDAADGRYRLLETVRLFARQHSAGAVLDGATERHASWCRRRVGDDLVDHFQGFLVADWVVAHWDDLRAAERHLEAGGRVDEAACLLVACGLALHLDLGTRATEASERIERLVPLVSSSDLRSRLHLTGVMCAMAARSPALLARHGAAGLESARAVDDPSLIATALVLASWSTVFDDPDRAVAMVEEASRLASGVGDPATRDLADSYRAFHLASLRRWDEAVAQAEAVLGRRHDDRALYCHYSAAVVVASCCVLADPDRALDLFGFVSTTTASLSMWANQVLQASIAASQGRASDTARQVRAVAESLGRSGQSGLPDLLVPAAILAHRLGDSGRATRYLRAIRDADRSTQSFPVTFLFRRTRDAVGIAEMSPLDSATLEEVGDEALDWLASLTGDARPTRELRR